MRASLLTRCEGLGLPWLGLAHEVGGNYGGAGRDGSTNRVALSTDWLKQGYDQGQGNPPKTATHTNGGTTQSEIGFSLSIEPCGLNHCLVWSSDVGQTRPLELQATQRNA